MLFLLSCMNSYLCISTAHLKEGNFSSLRKNNNFKKIYKWSFQNYSVNKLNWQRKKVLYFTVWNYLKMHAITVLQSLLSLKTHSKNKTNFSNLLWPVLIGNAAQKLNITTIYSVFDICWILVIFEQVQN